MAFSVSIGDFITTIDLIIEILGALDKTRGAAPQFQDLMATFESLKGALKATDAVDSNSDISAAIKRTEGSIECFLGKIEKYQPSLRVGGSKNKWKDAIRKIQWSLYQKDDVNNFRSEISLQVNSIQLLLLNACRYVFTHLRLWQSVYQTQDCPCSREEGGLGGEKEIGVH